MSGDVLIAVPCTEMMYTKAANGWVQLITSMPPGTRFQPWDSTASIPGKRNEIVRMLRDPRFEWVWMLDSDMVVPRGGFDVLISNADDADIIGALFCSSRAIGSPIEAGYVKNISDDPLRPTDREDFDFASLDVVGGGGIIDDVDFVGAGCTLYHRRVFDAVGFPWFVGNERYSHGQNEDWNLCIRAKQAGLRIIVDTRVRPEHLGVHAYVAEDRQTTEMWWEPAD